MNDSLGLPTSLPRAPNEIGGHESPGWVRITRAESHRKMERAMFVDLSSGIAGRG